jgi:membrane-associated phospholipid phosphatase
VTVRFALIGFLLLVTPAMADDCSMGGGVRAVESEIRQYGRDLKAIVLAPGSWRRDDWGRAALTVGTVALLMREDEHIANEVQRHRSSQTDSLARAITPFGGGRAIQLSVAMMVIGIASHNDRLRDTGRDSFEAEQIAAGLITPLLKRGLGRARPNQDELRPHDFDPWSSQESFPSGHATNAFALASAVAAHSNGWMVPTIAYSVATGVAFSRLNDNVHWASDVVAGAVIGTATGRAIARRHQAAGSHTDLSITPIIGPKTAGLRVRIAGW